MRPYTTWLVALVTLWCTACQNTPAPLEGRAETTTGTATVRVDGENASTTSPLGEGESFTVNAVRDAVRECPCGLIEVFNGNTGTTGERYENPLVLRQGEQRTEIEGPGTIFSHFKLVKATASSPRGRLTGAHAIKRLTTMCGRPEVEDRSFVRDGDLPAFDLLPGAAAGSSFGTMDVPMKILPDAYVAQIRRDETLPCEMQKQIEGIIAIVVEGEDQPCAFVRWKSGMTIRVTQTEVTATYTDYEPVIVCRGDNGFADIMTVFRTFSQPANQPALPPLQQRQ